MLFKLFTSTLFLLGLGLGIIAFGGRDQSVLYLAYFFIALGVLGIIFKLFKMAIKTLFLGLSSLVVLGLVIFLFHPVCVKLTDEQLKEFTTPVEQREDKDFYLKVFQQKNGEWYQCKTWISRKLFF